MTGDAGEPEIVLTVDPRSLCVDLRVIDGEFALIIGDGSSAITIERGSTGADWQEPIDGLRHLREMVDGYIDMLQGQASRAGLDREERPSNVIQLHGRNGGAR